MIFTLIMAATTLVITWIMATAPLPGLTWHTARSARAQGLSF